MSGRMQSQRGMNELRHFESVANSRMKREGKKGYVTFFICGCGSNCCGGTLTREFTQPTKKLVPVITKQSDKKRNKEYKEWLRIRAR